MSDELQGTPNCPNCLHPLEIAGTEERPYWACAHCGYTALTD